MKAFAVINPILEAIKYFYLKANNTCIRQKIDNIIRNREVTAEQAEAIMHPAMVLERFLDENIVMPSCAEELFGNIPCIEGADSLNTCIAALLTDRALRSEIRNIDEAEQLAALADTAAGNQQHNNEPDFGQYPCRCGSPFLQRPAFRAGGSAAHKRFSVEDPFRSSAL